MRRFLLILSGGLLSTASFIAGVQAAPIVVGTGVNSADVIFNWADGFIVEYDVRFDSASLNGLQLTQLVDIADENLSLTWDDFGFGQYLNVATYTGGHTGSGDTYVFNTAPENFWHEWVATESSDWTFGNGAETDTFTDGSKLGWTFGTAATPVTAVPEPVIGSAFVLAGMALLSRRQRAL